MFFWYGKRPDLLADLHLSQSAWPSMALSSTDLFIPSSPAQGTSQTDLTAVALDMENKLVPKNIAGFRAGSTQKLKEKGGRLFEDLKT